MCATQPVLRARGGVLAVLLCVLAAACAEPASPSQTYEVTRNTLPMILAPGWVTGTVWPTEAVVALNSISARSTSLVKGNVTVITAGTGTFLTGTAELSMAANAEIDGNVRADSIDMVASGHIFGTAAYNQLTGLGTIDGTKTPSLTTPVPLTVVATSNFTAGTLAINVSSGSLTTRNQGTYGVVTLSSGTRGDPTILRLNQGVFNFESITMGDFARLECKTTCEIRVKNRISTGSNSYIGVGGGGPAKMFMDGMKLFVEGANGTSGPKGLPAAVAIGARSELKAYTFIPNGTLVFGQSSTGVGKFVAKDVDIGVDVELMSGTNAHRVLLDHYVTGPTWPNELFTALNSIDVLSNTEVTGDAAVIQNGSGPFLNTSEAVIGTNARITGSLRADRVDLKAGSVVTGTVGYNTILGPGSAGTLSTPLLLPLDLRVPVFPVVTTGSSNVTVPARVDQTLAPGRYRDVILTAGISTDRTVLTLPGGVYEMRILTLGNYSSIICATACELRIKNRINPGENVRLGPTTGLDVSQVKVFIFGKSSSPGNTPFHASFGVNSTVEAFMFVSRGTLEVKSGVTLRGRFIARDIRLGSSVESEQTGVTLLAPAIQQQPQDITVTRGQSATFNVSATGSDITFQWNRNGTPIAGATGGSYTLPVTALSDDGASFTVTVSNSGGTLTSDAALLGVNFCDDMTHPPIATSCGVGACARTGIRSCVDGSVVDSCSAGTPAASDATCNNVDDDCNGAVDDDYVSQPTTCALGACASTGSTSCVGGVVQDSCVSTVPAADDSNCNGIDDDCNGQVDEDFVSYGTTCGVGVCARTGMVTCVGGAAQDSCEPDEPNGDEDSDTSCNGIDEDCDGEADDDYNSVTTSCGVGACRANGETDCVAGQVINSCQAGTNAPNDATCNGVDDDCNGQIDEDYVPTPSTCGVGACGRTGTLTCTSGVLQNSCTPGAPAANDVSCNNIDDNCNGVKDEGYVSTPTSCGVGGCGRTGATSCVAGAVQNSCTPGAPAANDVTCNNIDDNCNGSKDEGYASTTTSCGVGACGRTGATSCVAGAVQNSCTPGAPAANDATCNNIDEDCNGTADEDYVSTSTSCGVGACVRSGATSCVTGAVQNSCTPGAPAANDANCNNVDEDCSGTADEDYVSTATSCGAGACARSGALSCVAGFVQNSCTPGTPAANDAVCNGIDDDCNSQIDEDYVATTTSCGVGACVRTGVSACVSGAVQNNCTPGTPSANDAVCNNIDDDCNGAVDEDYVSLVTTCGTGTCTTNGATSCVSGTEQNSCVVPVADADGDGTADCADGCPNDPDKIAPEVCGCGTDELDTDGDAAPDCVDACPFDPFDDADGDNVCGDIDNCPDVANPGQEDANNNGTGNACDLPMMVAIAGGGQHSCSVLEDTQVTCWGANSDGQLGNGTNSEVAKPALVSNLNNVLEIVTGQSHTCALRDNGTVRCWGANASGQLGNGGNSSANVPVPVIALTDATQLAAGLAHTCALRATGEVTCWGDNANGQLGNGTLVAATTPVTVTGLSDAVEVAAGYGHSCALRATGEVVCWGANWNGQLGNDTLIDASTPTTVLGLSDVTQIAAGVLHTCAVHGAGQASCWGANTYGQLGDGSTTDASTPVAVLNVANASQIAAGQLHSCVVRHSGEISCWGYNGYGQLGDASLVDAGTPTDVVGVLDAVQVSTGDLHSCALLASAEVHCWGDGSMGQLGHGASEIMRLPTEVADLVDASQVTAGSYSTCAMRTNGQVSCWGSNGSGELGNGTFEEASTPLSVSLISDAVMIASGDAHSCAVHASGDVSCWGYGYDGELGHGLFSDANEPVAVSGITDAVAVAAGVSHSCAVHGSGDVSCWGYGGDGQLGDGLLTDSGTPVTVSGISDAIAISVGVAHSCAVRANGQIMCWGEGLYGRLGHGSANDASTPVTVSNITTAVRVAVGDYHSCALLANGGVRCWGRNSNGQLGDGTLAAATTPVATTGISTAVAVSSGAAHTCALLLDGSMRCWGANGEGQLGDGSSTRATTPTAVYGIVDATSIGTGLAHSCATRAAGDVLCWGEAGSGRLGNHYPWSKVPVLVDWSL